MGNEHFMYIDDPGCLVFIGKMRQALGARRLRRPSSKEPPMNSQDNPKDTPAWIFQVWASFVASVGVTAIGILFLPVSHWVRAFLGMGLLFVVGSCLSLAKTLRDNHEAKRFINRISEAKAEKIIRDFELDSQRRAA
jgi:hypothetical protein